MRKVFVILLFCIIGADATMETPEEFVQRLKSEGAMLQDMGSLPSFFSKIMELQRNFYCEDCMKICKHRKGKFRPGSDLDLVVKANPWLLTDRPRDQMKCPQFCTYLLWANLPAAIDRATAGFIHLSQFVAQDDPRRETVNGHADHAKSQVEKYRCYPEDYPSSKTPKPGGSSGRGTGFGNTVRAPSKRHSPADEGKGSRGKNSEAKPGCMKGSMGSTQFQDQQLAEMQCDIGLDVPFAVGRDSGNGGGGTGGSGSAAPSLKTANNIVPGPRWAKAPGRTNRFSTEPPEWLKNIAEVVKNGWAIGGAAAPALAKKFLNLEWDGIAPSFR